MALTSPWIYQPNVNGPVITAKQGRLIISRDPKTVTNQSTMLSIQAPESVEGGVILQFDIGYSVIQVPVLFLLMKMCATHHWLFLASYRSDANLAQRSHLAI
jgi:hypothetical protein